MGEGARRADEGLSPASRISQASCHADATLLRSSAIFSHCVPQREKGNLATSPFARRRSRWEKVPEGRMRASHPRVAFPKHPATPIQPSSGLRPPSPIACRNGRRESGGQVNATVKPWHHFLAGDDAASGINILHERREPLPHRLEIVFGRGSRRLDVGAHGQHTVTAVAGIKSVAERSRQP